MDTRIGLRDTVGCMPSYRRNQFSCKCDYPSRKIIMSVMKDHYRCLIINAFHEVRDVLIARHKRAFTRLSRVQVLFIFSSFLLAPVFWLETVLFAHFNTIMRTFTLHFFHSSTYLTFTSCAVRDAWQYCVFCTNIALVPAYTRCNEPQCEHLADLVIIKESFERPKL